MNTNRYNDYAKLFGEVVLLSTSLSTSRRSLSDMRKMIKEEDTSGRVGLDFSSHAVDKVQERLEILAKESSVIYQDVFNTESPSESIIWPSNTKAFILGMMAKAAENDSVHEEPSRSTQSAVEYHYKIEVKKWSTDNKKLVFVGIVENNVIKTTYFNWV